MNDGELMQVVMQLRNEIRMPQGQATVPSPVPSPLYTPVGHNSPLSQMSACAGFNPSITNTPSKPTPSTSAAPRPSGPQSSGGSSSSSSDAGRGRDGGGGGNPGDGAPPIQRGGSSIGQGHASIGIGSIILGSWPRKMCIDQRICH